MFFVLSLVALIAHTTSGAVFGIVSERMIRRLRDRTLRKLLRQDLSWFELPSNSPAHLISMINMDTGHLSGLSGVILGTLCTVLVSMAGGIILAHVVAWKVAVVILAAVPVMIAAGFFRLKILSKFEERHETAYLAAAELATEACNAIRTVAALGREDDVIKSYHNAIEKPYRESLRFIISGNVWLALSLAITYAFFPFLLDLQLHLTAIQVLRLRPSLLVGSEAGPGRILFSARILHRSPSTPLLCPGLGTNFQSCSRSLEGNGSSNKHLHAARSNSHY